MIFNHGPSSTEGRFGLVAKLGEERITIQRSQLSRIDLSLVVISAWWSH